MGQPKFPRKKYDTPNHPWQGERIKGEKDIQKKFGLKNKREIWKAQSRLRSIRSQARVLISRSRNPADDQATREASLLLKRLWRQGYVGEGASLNEVLGLDVERILNRRLQSQVYLKGLARTPKQARQFISHGLIQIGERRVTVPSYVVRREEEEQIRIDPSKSVADENHPVRPKAPGQEVIPQAREPEETPTRSPSPAPAPVPEPEAVEPAAPTEARQEAAEAPAEEAPETTNEEEGNA